MGTLLGSREKQQGTQLLQRLQPFQRALIPLRAGKLGKREARICRAVSLSKQRAVVSRRLKRALGLESEQKHQPRQAEQEPGSGQLSARSQKAAELNEQQSTSHTSPSHRKRGILLLNLLVVLCGINWVVLKKSESLIDPSTFCISRFGVAALAFWPYFSKVDKDILYAGLDIGVWAAIGYLAQAQGLLTTDASHASFISALTVIVVPILVGLSGRGVRALTWISAFVAFIGVGMLEDGFSAPCTGDLYQLGSAVAFGFQIWRTEHYSNKLQEGSALPLMSVVVATIAAASLGLTVLEHIPQSLSWAQHPAQILAEWSTPSFSQIFPVVWSALMSTDLVLLIELLALHDVSSTDASIIYSMEPLLGAGFAYLLLGERWGPLGWVGACLIFASSLFTQLHSLAPANSDESK